MFALVDGDNFYCGVEVSFAPHLRSRPLVVLSNNDGCAIARSEEAKALGVKMGAPFFKWRSLAREHGIVTTSANFALYGEMSNRMMSIAAGLGSSQEVYSIDECWIGMDGIQGDLVARGQLMREKIQQWLGLGTGIGYGQTKTLAKLSNRVAKQAYRKPGSYPAELARVCNLAALPASDFDAVLQATDVGDVWGIGRRIGQQLHEEGVMNVLQLIQLDPATVRRRWSLVLERTVRELQGQACITLELEPPAKREIAFTRSFGHTVTSLQDLTEAVTEFTSAAAVKLRAQGSLAGQVHVFIQTSPFRPPPQYSRSSTVPLRRPTADTSLLVKAALLGLDSIYRPGFDFSRAGIMLMDLQDGSVVQNELELEPEKEANAALMGVLDRLNDRYGRGTVKLASAGLGGQQRPWTMKQQKLSPRYTTRWDQLPVARA